MPKTITLLTSGTRGDVQPYLALGIGLRDAGHAIRIATHENFAAQVAQWNLPFARLDDNPSDLFARPGGEYALRFEGNPLRHLRVIEAGAGIGTMIERLIERGVLTHALYTAIDANPDNIAELKRRRLDNTRGVTIEPKTIDIFDFVARVRGQRTWDLLIAHAFLDLLDLPRALPQLFSLLRRGGLFYFTINFDGATIFEPVIDSKFDAEIERLYHQTMDERVTHGTRPGDSRTGRHLFRWLHESGAAIVQAGSSDWVVFAGAQGYAHDAAYSLHFIVDTLREALEHHPGLANQRERFCDWIARRHRQIEEGALVYIAHQLDFVGRRRVPSRRNSL